MLEIELKYELMAESDYMRIQSHLNKPSDKKSQINIYIDSDDSIFRQLGLAMRLRIEKNRIMKNTITSKSKININEGLFISDENEKLIEPDIISAIIKGKITANQILEILGLSKYHIPKRSISILSYSLVKRVEYSHKELILTLDRVVFPNGLCDYELECEHDNPKIAGTEIESLLKDLAINYKKQKMTKRCRACLNMPERKNTDLNNEIMNIIEDFKIND